MKLIEEIEACCPSVLQSPLGAQEAAQLAAAFRVLGDPARLRLLNLIAAQPEQQACVCDVTAPLGVSQPTVSHHLKVLHDAGLLERERRGSWVYYRVVPERLRSLREALAQAEEPSVPAPA